MKRHLLTIGLLVTLLLVPGGGGALARPPAGAGAPTIISYQGQVTVAGVPYGGSAGATGYFKFAIVDSGGATTYWSNAAMAGAQPKAAVSLTVTNGLFTVLLGDTSLTNMAALPATAFSSTERYLRVWFSSDGATFAQLTPDRRIAAVPYALQAQEALTADQLGGVAASGYFNLAQNVTVTGQPAFNGGNSGTTAPFTVDSNFLVANLNADLLDGNQASAFAAANHNHGTSYWQLGGNAGTTGSSFLGTSDLQALELRVNGACALRLEPHGTSPNVIGGHENNSVGSGAQGATIGGGGDADNPNSVSGYYGTIGGGGGNSMSGLYGTIGGGYWNQASGSYATVGGGDNNTASGLGATVPGGFVNKAVGDYSFAAGLAAYAKDYGSFVWGDGSLTGAVASTAANQFIVRASGGIWLGTDNSVSLPAGRFLNTSTGAYLSSGGEWKNSSDRNAKENLAPVDVRALLDRLAAMPISTWNYKAEDASVRHMGPMAQDFYASFGLGDNETSIGTIDADGVALAAIQGLYQQSQDQAARIAELEDENAALRQGMAGIEARLAALEQAGSGR